MILSNPFTKTHDALHDKCGEYQQIVNSMKTCPIWGVAAIAIDDTFPEEVFKEPALRVLRVFTRPTYLHLQPGSLEGIMIW